MGFFQPTNTNNPNYMSMRKRQQKEEAQLFGYAIKYLRPTEIEEGKIFSESVARDFTLENGFSMFSKREDDSLYMGDNTFGGFGLLPQYKQILYIPVLFFEDNALSVPLEGDVILDERDNILFQISKVGELDELQPSLRINDVVLSYKVYLKEYLYSYKDKFDSSFTEGLGDDFNNQDTTNLNSELNTDIDDLDIIDEADLDKIFGSFG